MINISKLGFDSMVSVNTMDGHPISCYKPFNYDKVLTLCETMTILIHQYTETTSKVLHYLSLSKSTISEIETHVLELCNQERFIAVSSHNVDEGTRDKMYFLELDSSFKPNVLDIISFSGPDDRIQGSVIFDLKLNVYHEGYPILTCLELDGLKRIQVYSMHNGMFNQILESPNHYQNVCLMTRDLDPYWWSIDMKGNIYRGNSMRPNFKIPKQERVRSNSPNLKKYESNLSQTTFIANDPGHNYDSIESVPVSSRRQRYKVNKKRQRQRTPVRVTQTVYDSSAGSPFNKSKVIHTSPFNLSNQGKTGMQSPLYDSQTLMYMNQNSANKSPKKIDPIMEGGRHANDPVYHSPNSQFKPWGRQPQYSPKRGDQIQVFDSQYQNNNIPELEINHTIKNDPNDPYNDRVVRNNSLNGSQVPYDSFREQIGSKFMSVAGGKYSELVDYILNPKVIETPFTSCKYRIFLFNFNFFRHQYNSYERYYWICQLRRRK